MPEIGEAPQAQELITEIPAPIAFNVLTDTFKNYEHHAANMPVIVDAVTEIAKNADKYAALLKKKHPDVPEEDIETVIDVTFGPMRMAPNAPEVQNGNKEELYKYIETSARIQHAYSHMILEASRPDGDKAFAESVFGRVAFMDYLSKSPLGESRGYRQFWNGVKTEVAVIKALTKQGYRVTIPDYDQSDYDEQGNLIPQAEKQVFQWDIKCGIDMIAEKDGTVLFVDAKGQNKTKEGMDRVIPDITWKIPSRIPSTLQTDYSPQLKGNWVKQMTIILPTSKYYLSGVSSSHMKMEDKRVALRDFGVSSFETDIAKCTNQIQTAHSRRVAYAVAS